MRSKKQEFKIVKLNKLPKTTKRGKKRLGQGYGSGKGGHTVGRGSKGAKARGKIPLYFEGAAVGASLIKRLPLLRGKGKHKPFKDKPIIVNVKYLNLLPKNSLVDIKTLLKYKIIKEKEAKRYAVKILGDGELKIPLIVKLPCSNGAKKKIETVGGKVERQERKKESSNKTEKVN